MSGSENVVYVAHDGGIARVDMTARRVTALAGPKGLDLSGFAAIRMHRDSVIGLQASVEGPLQLVRLTLNAAGRTVREAAVIDRQVATGDGRVVLNVTGDDLYYLANAAPPAGAADVSGRPEVVPLVIRHVTLR
jgi:hypothetical protein